MFANIIGPTQSVDSDAGMGMRCLMGSLVSLKYLSASVVRFKRKEKKKTEEPLPADGEHKKGLNAV